MKAARLFKFSSAVAVAALLAGSAMAANAVLYNYGARNAAVLRYEENGFARRKAERLSRALNLNERKYREIYEFYAKEMRHGNVGPFGEVAFEREEKAMRRILNGREYKMWMEMQRRGEFHIPGHGHGHGHNHKF